MDYRRSMVLGGLAAVAAMLSASGADAQTCNGVAVPPWASCVNNKLSVPGGGAWGAIDFEIVDTGGRSGLGWGRATGYGGEHLRGCTPDARDWLIYSANQDADWEWDVYQNSGFASDGPGCRSVGTCPGGGEHIAIWGSDRKRHTLIKNYDTANAIRPECPGGDPPHTDIVDFCGGLHDGGWVVIQDSRWKNGDGEAFHSGDATTCEWCGTHGKGWVFQNLSVTFSPSFASDSGARCQGRSPSQTLQHGDGPWISWFIEYRGVPAIIFHGSKYFVMIRNTASIVAADNNWSGAQEGERYFYDSIEDALAASYASCLAQPSAKRPDGCDQADFPHERPPFLHLSSAGWANPPTGGGTPLPAPPPGGGTPPEPPVMHD